jgi:hypothetical protein
MDISRYAKVFTLRTGVFGGVDGGPGDEEMSAYWLIQAAQRGFGDA